MKKVIIWGTVLFFLILDWLALDDITTGNEPDLFLEYAVLFISFLVFGLIGFTAFKHRQVTG